MKPAKMWRTRDRVWAVLLALSMGVGCGVGPDPGSVDGAAPPPWEGVTASEFLSSLEDGLLAAETVALEFDIVAEGAFEANLVGWLRFEQSGALELEAQGSFGREPVTLTLSARDGRMAGGGTRARFDESVPPAVREALVIGLTRMGILHNLARLVAGVPPDRASGGVRDWVEVREIAWTDDVEVGERGVRFEIWVAGQPAGEATLGLNGHGQVVGRNQVVRFPGGEMLVRERYRIH
jgi:hypothetical protein